MTATISSAFISQFSGNLHMLLSQTASKLMPVVDVEMAKGEKHFFDRIGVIEANTLTGRLEPTSLQDMPHSRRMATVSRHAAVTYLDTIDKLKMLVDPSSAYAKRLAEALGRKFDTTVIEALYGTASTGADGTGTADLDNTRNKIAHGSAGFTFEKLLQARRMLNSYEADGEKAFVLVSARGLEDLLTETEIQSIDNNVVRPLVSGEIDTFLGFTFIRSERIADITASSVYRALVFTEGAVKVAMAESINLKVAERADLNHAVQIAAYMTMGAVRMEEDRVVEIAYQ